MTWNYRVISHPSWDMSREKGERVFRIHEVFSDESGIVGYSAQGCQPYGETEEELAQDMKYMNLAFEKPVLRVEDLPSDKFGEQNGAKASATTSEKNRLREAEKTTARPTTQSRVVEI